ncbi:hypothetical protein KCP74_10590 [Salmonella enterica subsp. enterica]|nr:hypothetical protein KCP74_10590 [Salmonella enterica subsp. enterica]
MLRGGMIANQSVAALHRGSLARNNASLPSTTHCGRPRWQRPANLNQHFLRQGRDCDVGAGLAQHRRVSI